ncbi:MAG: hypothetical protein COB96_04830 [Planctomycetota bacterium]|jgi:hypothetical protein|nr:MAG: hypothetical protein COB96_04830 [Planctomycetota bacterium]
MVLRAEVSEYEIQALVIRLQEARMHPMVRLLMHDGRELEGALTYQDRFGDGRIINIEKETSFDYNLYEVKEVIY